MFGKRILTRHRKIWSDWRADSAGLRIEATTTNPTKASAGLFDNCFFRRIGDSMELRWNYAYSNPAGSAAGSGTYLIRLPSTYAIDGNKIRISITLGRSVCGHGVVVYDTGPLEVFYTMLWPYDSNRIAIAFRRERSSIYNPIGVGSTTIGAFGSPILRYFFHARVPIVSWTGRRYGSPA